MTYLKCVLNAIMIVVVCCAISACGFHLQGDLRLAKPLQRLYLQTADPYGQLARYLEQYLMMSHVQLVSSPKQASAILTILQDSNSQSLLSVSATQQTRQYNLTVSVQYDITDAKGRPLISKQSLRESRALTIQSNQILGSSNEATLMYQQIRRSIAYAIITRLASQEMSQAITHDNQTTAPSHSRKQE